LHQPVEEAGAEEEGEDEEGGGEGAFEFQGLKLQVCKGQEASDE